MEVLKYVSWIYLLNYVEHKLLSTDINSENAWIVNVKKKPKPWFS